MRFRKTKRPKALELKPMNAYVSNTGTATIAIVGQPFGTVYFNCGPKGAIELARWLQEYSKWSSLQEERREQRVR